MNITYLKGDLIAEAHKGEFDVIAHGCHCFCSMAEGLARQMRETFNAHLLSLESPSHKGDINKLGQIEWASRPTASGEVVIVNCYTQYIFHPTSKPFDYDAFTVCLKKMNHVFKGKHIGFPKIGTHKAGGDWDVISYLIERELTDCTVSVVEYALTTIEN